MLQYAGWEGGDDLPGALQVEQNAKLQSLFIDGTSLQKPQKKRKKRNCRENKEGL